MVESRYQGWSTHVAKRQLASLSGPARWSSAPQRMRMFTANTYSRIFSDETREQNISVTNYTGESRDYLKKLIGVMDAQFTTTLAREANTHLIAAT
jgi:hypothetical protein